MTKDINEEEVIPFSPKKLLHLLFFNKTYFIFFPVLTTHIKWVHPNTAKLLNFHLYLRFGRPQIITPKTMWTNTKVFRKWLNIPSGGDEFRSDFCKFPRLSGLVLRCRNWFAKLDVCFIVNCVRYN